MKLNCLNVGNTNIGAFKTDLISGGRVRMTMVIIAQVAPPFSHAKEMEELIISVPQLDSLLFALYARFCRFLIEWF